MLGGLLRTAPLTDSVFSEINYLEILEIMPFAITRLHVYVRNVGWGRAQPAGIRADFFGPVLGALTYQAVGRLRGVRVRLGCSACNLKLAF